MFSRFAPRSGCLAFAFFLTLAHAQTPPPPPQVIVVTGTYEPVPLDEINRDIRLFDLKNTQPLFDSIAEVLQLDSSVDLRQRGTNDIQGDLSIRGSTFAQTLVLLNGLRLNDSQTAHANLDFPLPVEALSEVQILHGPGASRYGSDAAGGVVNLITSTGPPELRVRSGLGNFGTNQQSATLAGSLRQLSERLVFSRDLSTGFRDDRDYRNFSFGSISHVKTKLGDTDIVLALSDRLFGADQYYGNFNSQERTKGWFGSLRQQLGSNTEINFAFRRHTDLYVLYRDRPQVFTNRHAVESYEAAVRRSHALFRGQLHYGAEGYFDSIDSNNLGIHRRAREAVYASYDLLILRRVSVTAGLRDEIYRRFQHQLSPTFAAAYWLRPQLKLRASVARAFRLPTFTDLYYHDPANVGSPNLRPETSWSLDAGLSYLPNSKLRADVAVFQRRDTDLIDYVRNSPKDIYRATNFQNLRFTGVEASVEYRPWRGHQLSAQYTGLSGNRALAPNVISKYVFQYLRNSGVVAWQGTFHDRVIARTRIGIADRYNRSPYALWDASAAWNKGLIRPYLQLTNISATKYQEIPGVAMPGRAFVAGLSLVFSRQ